MEQTIFLAVANKYKNSVYRIALNYYGNTYDAEDTVQEVMIKLYTSTKSFESDEHIRNWLIRVTVNACKSTLRMPWRKRNISLDDISEPMMFETAEQSDLYQTVMCLPEKDRTVLYLFYYEDYSVKEIAGILKLKESAVTTRLSRARQKLKQNLTEVWQDE
ncbi:MAG: sigma-70 family RNA polymerase sigma factor [Lawsonibacter sp.]|nr:sigma-70 family RNA polymerase sigma factor [Lawsonibacter sp.]